MYNRNNFGRAGLRPEDTWVVISKNKEIKSVMKILYYILRLLYLISHSK